MMVGDPDPDCRKRAAALAPPTLFPPSRRNWRPVSPMLPRGEEPTWSWRRLVLLHPFRRGWIY